MNPSKLKAFVDQNSSAPDMSSLVGMPASSADDDLGDDDELEDEEPAAPVDPMARGNELIASWGDQGEALKEAAGEIVDGAHEIGGDLLLAKVPEEADEEVEDNFEGMPEDIQITLAQRVAPLPESDITALATALIDGHDGDTETADMKLVTTYITKVAAIAKTEVDPEDFVQPEEEDEDEEKEDETGESAPVAAAGESAAPVPAPSGPLA